MVGPRSPASLLTVSWDVGGPDPVRSPLGFAVGMPFALGMRALPAAAAEALPWGWAVNAWTSVLSGSPSVFLVRLFGHTVGFLVALVVYATALLLAPRLARVGVATSVEIACSAPAAGPTGL